MVVCHMCLCVGPAMDWQSVQAVPCLSLFGSWERLQCSPGILNRLKQVWGMDGWIEDRLTVLIRKEE